jgi:alcohol dehydrogenase
MGPKMERKSYRVTKAGSLKRLKVVNENINEPAENEVCVEIKAIGLNFADVFTIMGLYKAAPKKDFIPGLEFSGIVYDKGRKVTDLEINQRVMGVIRLTIIIYKLCRMIGHLKKVQAFWYRL